MIRIRSSSLPYYPDCPRKWAYKSLPRDIIEGLGFKMKAYVPNVAAKLGTGTHSGAALSLNEKMNGIVTNLDNMCQAGIESFREEIHEGVVWDKLTNNVNTAEKQIQKVLRAYYGIILPTIDPVDVELSLKAKIDEDYYLSGHMDANCLDSIHDFKSGVRDPLALTQMGGYSILKKANGLGQAKKLIIDHIKRTALSKPQEAPVIVEYNVENCEAEAKSTYKNMIRDTNEFLSSGDPMSFQANMHSILCSPKYCTAHGTSWCKLTM